VPFDYFLRVLVFSASIRTKYDSGWQSRKRQTLARSVIRPPQLVIYQHELLVSEPSVSNTNTVISYFYLGRSRGVHLGRHVTDQSRQCLTISVPCRASSEAFHVLGIEVS
jgi:hypothetical protein